MIEIDLLRKLLRYDPESGKLFWRGRPREMFKTDRAFKTWNTRYCGSEALTAVSAQGYRVGNINYVLHSAHRVIWALCKGQWPEYQIDHIDGNKTNNIISNLRDVTVAMNGKNSKIKSNNTSGFNGVCWCKTKLKWKARVTVNKVPKSLGYFEDIEKAVSARKVAEAGLGFTDRHGS